MDMKLLLVMRVGKKYHSSETPGLNWPLACGLPGVYVSHNRHWGKISTEHIILLCFAEIFSTFST